MNCTKTQNHSRIKVEENKRKAVFINESRDNFDVSVVDGCLIKSGVRTDYLVSKISLHSVLVELKGVDVQHACEQLLSSAVHPSVVPLIRGRLGFLVVCSRYPRFDSYVAKAKQTAMKRFKAGFHVVSGKIEVEIERVTAIDGM